MFKNSKTFSSFSVNDLEKAKTFYGEVLGVDVTNDRMPGVLNINLPDNKVIIYSKKDHTPASFTVLNFITDDVEKTVDELAAKGVKFEHYDKDQLKTDAKGILRDNGPMIAWFKDPAGNVLSVIGENY